MNRPDKIQVQHRQRQALVYIRQSTLRQVAENRESRDLQYQLVQRAQTLGWREKQVVAIDDDLGKSAVTAANRPGFQAVVTAVGLGQVGIILVTDVSRLARNCSDWYQLLDLASLRGTLISDPHSLYDPRDYNDRLLLGLKGTFSEAQWHQMRQRLRAAQFNKARRGELATLLPVGYERTEAGEVVMIADREVQNAIDLVLSQFESLGSARQVLLYFRQQQLELPRQIQSGPQKGTIEWVKPSYQAVYRILKHPAYAGAYTYGKKQRIRLPGAPGKVITRSLPMSEWAVLQRDALPGYITWEQYLQNQERLRINGRQARWHQGSPCKGRGLLQGIVWCGRCGRRLQTRYSNQPAYVCQGAQTTYGEPLCQNFMVPHIDQAVAPVFLAAVAPARLQTALATMAEVTEQRQQLSRQWQQRLERAGYEADLARRRYEQVDPDNRLVAAELEQRWEEKLQVLDNLTQAWRDVQAQEVQPLSEADKELIRQLATDLPALWQADTTTFAERKRLLRCLVQDVTLDARSKPGFSLIYIRWHTGATTIVEAERPKPGCRTAKEVVARIRSLAQEKPDDQIAQIFNGEKILTATGQSWTRRRVENVRKNHSIPTACPYFTPTKGPRGDGLIAATEAATRLGVSGSMVAYWFRQGLIVGQQRRPRTALWVRLTEADRQRWDGSAQLQENMIPLPEVSQTLGLSSEQMKTEVQAGRLLTYRFRVKNRWRWYIQVTA